MYTDLCPDSILQILFTMNTGLFTSMCAVASLISVCATRDCVVMIFSTLFRFSRLLRHSFTLRSSLTSVGVSIMFFIVSAIHGITELISIHSVYSNSLLATLNARNSIRGTLSDTQTVSLRNIRPQCSTGSAAQTLKVQRPGPMMAIKVDTTSAYHSDAANGLSEAEVRVPPL